MVKNYRTLSSLGIELWQPDQSKHPSFSNALVKVVPDEIKIFAKCLVVLPLVKPLDQSASRILTGMLEVLNLSPRDQMIVNVYSMQDKLSHEDWLYVDKVLDSWQPQSILQLAVDGVRLSAAARVVQTYHPSFLQEHPQNKRKAFIALLDLKKCLHYE